MVSRASWVPSPAGRSSAAGPLRPQLLAQVAEGQVGQVVGPLGGQGQVGGQGGVHGQPGQLPAAGPDGQVQVLGVVGQLGPLRVGQQRRQRLQVLRPGPVLQVEPDRAALLSPQAGAGQLGLAGAGAQAGGQGDRLAGGHPGQPGGQLALGQPAGVDLEPGVHRAGVDRGREQPLAQRVELQGVEQAVDLGPVPGAHAQVAHPDGQGHVVAQPHQLLVAEHVLAVGEQVLLELAPLLVGVGHHLLGGAVGLDQLGGGLVADPGDPGQVVGGVAAQGGHVDVASRRHAVAFLDGGLVVDGGVGDAAPGHHHPDLGLVVDELQVVPVPGDDQHRQPLLPGLLDQGGDQVVGLVPGDLDHRDPQGGQHLPDQRHLGAEVVGGGPAVGLVAVVDVVAVGGPAQVEADRDPVRREVAEQLDQHGGEAVDDVGQLPGGRLQVAGQGEEGPVGEAVPVQQDQRGRGGRFGGGHAAESINRSRRGRPCCPPSRRHGVA